MTWGEFKASVEALGITDDALMWYVNWYRDEIPRVMKAQKEWGLGYGVWSVEADKT